jgi:outer membrane putative beta-barrel porin/alpha-amylase
MNRIRLVRLAAALSMGIGPGCAASAAALAADACADSGQDIATDRPSVTNSSLTVPRGSLQFENGITWTAWANYWTLDGPETRVRAGILPCTELLADLPNYFDAVFGYPATGFSDFAPAIKHQFSGLPPGTTMSATAGLQLPTGARGISGSGYNPYLQFPWSQQLSERWTAAGMLSTLWVTGQPVSTTIIQPSFLLDRQIGPRSDAFVEYVGDFQTRGTPSALINIGISYRTTKVQQIDFHVSFGFNRNAPDYIVGVGYSFRFDGFW